MTLERDKILIVRLSCQFGTVRLAGLMSEPDFLRYILLDVRFLMTYRLIVTYLTFMEAVVILRLLPRVVLASLPPLFAG
jgi:hypothetical protein